MKEHEHDYIKHWRGDLVVDVVCRCGARPIDLLREATMTTTPGPRTERLYQCPGCWSWGMWPLPKDEHGSLECECGQRLTRIDLRDSEAEARADVDGLVALDQRLLLRAMYARMPYTNWTADAEATVAAVAEEYNRLLAEDKAEAPR